MRKFIVSLAAIAAVTAAAPAVAKPGNGHGGHKAQKHQKHQNGGENVRYDRVRENRLFGDDRAFAQRGGACPPGLAKKNNGCLPPGQAKKLGVGDRLPTYLSRYNVPEQYRDRYYDDRNYSYRYENDNIYRVNRGSGVIDSIISVLGL